MKDDKRGNWEAIGSSFHLGSTLPNLASQRSYGPKVQKTMGHMYAYVQILSKGPLPSPQHRLIGITKSTCTPWTKSRLYSLLMMTTFVIRGYLSKIDRTNIQRPDRFGPRVSSIARSSPKFLGYMLTKRGIEANLDKYKTIIIYEPTQISMKPTIEPTNVCSISYNASWKDPIGTFLWTEKAPNDPLAAKKLIREASKYTLIFQQLYKRDFLTPS
ncbi:hypothetical protein CR513_28334, partial [Mucuna pruriens]